MTHCVVPTAMLRVLRVLCLQHYHRALGKQKVDMPILFFCQERLIQEGTPAELLATPAEEAVIRFFRMDTVLTGEIRPATEGGPPLFWWNGRAIAPMPGERTGMARIFIGWAGGDLPHHKAMRRIGGLANPNCGGGPLCRSDRR